MKIDCERVSCVSLCHNDTHQLHARALGPTVVGEAEEMERQEERRLLLRELHLQVPREPLVAALRSSGHGSLADASAFLACDQLATYLIGSDAQDATPSPPTLGLTMKATATNADDHELFVEEDMSPQSGSLQRLRRGASSVQDAAAGVSTAREQRGSEAASSAGTSQSTNTTSGTKSQPSRGMLSSLARSKHSQRSGKGRRASEEREDAREVVDVEEDDDDDDDDDDAAAAAADDDDDDDGDDDVVEVGRMDGTPIGRRVPEGDLVGQRIEVYFRAPTEGWFRGRVSDFCTTSDKHEVTYDLTDWHMLNGIEDVEVLWCVLGPDVPPMGRETHP